MVRFKNRYLLCHVEANVDAIDKLCRMESRDISQLIRASITRNFGDLAFGQLISSLTIKLWSPTLSLCLVRCARDHYRTLWAAITLITCLNLDFDGRDRKELPNVRFTVIHVGGTIRSCEKTAIDHARQLILHGRAMNSNTAHIQMASVSVQRELQQQDL